MRWLAAYGCDDPVVIPRSGVTRNEVQQTLQSRLLSHYKVKHDSEPDKVNIEFEAKRLLSKPDQQNVTIRVTSRDICTEIAVQSHGRHVRRFRRLLRSAPELRVGPINPTRGKDGEIPDNLVSLLSVYAGQFGSYTTLLWQVPAWTHSSGVLADDRLDARKQQRGPDHCLRALDDHRRRVCAPHA